MILIPNDQYVDESVIFDDRISMFIFLASSLITNKNVELVL